MDTCLSELAVASVFWINFQLSFASESLDVVVLDNQKKDVLPASPPLLLNLQSPLGEKKSERECSIPSFHHCICQVPSLALCLVLLLLVSFFNRHDRFCLTPFLRIFLRFSLLLFFFMEERWQLSLPLHLTVFLFSFLFPLSVFVLSCHLPASLYFSGWRQISVFTCTRRMDINGVFWLQGYCCLQSVL